MHQSQMLRGAQSKRRELCGVGCRGGGYKRRQGEKSRADIFLPDRHRTKAFFLDLKSQSQITFCCMVVISFFG